MNDPVVQRSLADMVAAFRGTEVEWDLDWVGMWADDLWYSAEVLPGRSRVRITVVLASLDASEIESAKVWADVEARRSPAIIEVWEDSEDNCLAAVFERPLDSHGWTTDPLPRIAAELWYAWDEGRTVAVADADLAVFGDPILMTPASAWLMTGTAAAFSSPDEEAAMWSDARVSVYDHLWTAAKQTAVGDLLLFYFTAPHKLIRYAARAASDAFFSTDLSVNSDQEVASQQWWVYTTPLIEIEPVSFRALTEAAQGHLIVKGRSGRFLHPDIVDRLNLAAHDPRRQHALDAVFRRPNGMADLSDPRSLSINELREIASGALRIEQDVSMYVVEPLLRLIGVKRENWRREYRVGRGLADYVVVAKDLPKCVVEVKLATVLEKDMKQLQRYSSHLKCPGILIDSRRILLAAAASTTPLAVFERSRLSTHDLKRIRAHVLRQ